jgi:amylosucrase
MEAGEDLTNTDTLEWRLFNEMVKLFKQRKQSSALRNGGMALADTGNPHLFVYIKDGGGQRLLIINNFSEYPQVMNVVKLEASGMTSDTH